LKGRRYGFAAAIGIGVGILGTALSGFCLTQARLAGRFAAKEVCSCRFVFGQTEEYCRDYARVGPSWGLTTSVDLFEKKVHTQAFTVIRASAAFLGPKVGCALDP
jgi:hypothetical protein